MIRIFVLLSCCWVVFSVQAQRRLEDSLAIRLQRLFNQEMIKATHPIRFYRHDRAVFVSDPPAWWKAAFDSLIVDNPHMEDSVAYELRLIEEPIADTVVLEVEKGFHLRDRVFVNYGTYGGFKDGMRRFLSDLSQYLQEHHPKACLNDTVTLLFKKEAPYDLLLAVSRNKVLEGAMAAYFLLHEDVHLTGIRYGEPTYSAFSFSVHSSGDAYTVENIGVDEFFALQVGEESVLAITYGASSSVAPFQKSFRFLFDRKLSAVQRKSRYMQDVGPLQNACLEEFFGHKRLPSNWYVGLVLQRFPEE